MTFYTYMMRNYRDTDGPMGDLADDMHFDREHFPRNGRGKYVGWHDLIRRYLESCGACDECLAVFEEAWEEYVICEKKRSSRNSESK